MLLKEKLDALNQLSEWILTFDDELEERMHRAKAENPWFTLENQKKSLAAIAEYYLKRTSLESWLSPYRIDNYKGGKRVGLILAGNIPLVGFHDILSCFVTDHVALIKYSDKDKVLIPILLNKLKSIDPRSEKYFENIERLKDFDAVIATGSNNSSRYFESYFSKYPHIIRKNRNGIAVLTGEETAEDFKLLGTDIFDYFGLGCRNVSKMYVPENYDFNLFMETTHGFNQLAMHHKYKNNFDYCVALSLLNKEQFLNNGCLILIKKESIQSRISTLHYSEYQSITTLEQDLATKNDEIQCIVGSVKIEGLNTYGFGMAQKPQLMDYADGVDTIQFLMQLN